MKIVKVFIKNIGEVTFKQSKKYKRLKISLAPFKGVVVTYPINCSFSSAIIFVNKKLDWIEEKIKIITEYENKSIFNLNNKDCLTTKYHTINFVPHRINSIKTITENRSVTIFYPFNKSINDHEIQSYIKNIVIKVLRKEAIEYLPKRVNFLANSYGFKYNKLSLRNNKSRWGSCNRNNDISLNIHLMRLPDHLIDFVILHELVHTIHKNHGNDFWKCLRSIVKDADNYRRELKNYQPILW